MQFDFSGQTAIVVGGTRGIGRAISEAFLQSGAKVIATYQSNDQAADAFRDANANCANRLDLQKFDITQYNQVENFFRLVEEKHGPFQIMVNSSGIRNDSVVGLMKETDWQRVIDTNLTGTFNICKQAVLSLMRQRYGRIILITSPIGKFGFAGQSNYAASKAGQVAFARSLSKEVASRKITVNCVSPGFIETDFIADLSEEQRKGYIALIPLKRFGSAPEVAHSVLFLASKESSYITGTVNEVTGGL
ncbi:MAG: 3-oxoacyl-ACP reductase FabG [Nitrospinae bacterium]|nr:3-oxoacyl-ACP reductase FabG [Nitrospinota bacterium]